MKNLKPYALIVQMKSLGSITEREPSINDPQVQPHRVILFSILIWPGGRLNTGEGRNVNRRRSHLDL